MTLFLKYRPQDFESLVGQDFIKNTLRQAILKDKLVGAYLFCGPRGTGKTSTARIFAKTINCLDLHEGNPCGKCEICTQFNEESLVDIIEIDAASYTGVDNIRDIIERAQFSPTKCKYKVYIIDEVHMLSKGAFNALLKILEEPPSHLKFILATTESHKIPETILSRCQRYDFKSFTKEDTKNQILYIAGKENIKIDSESIDFIIKQSAGGMRNAISLFEQLIYNGEVKFENVINNYGIPKTEVISNFYEKLIKKDNSLVEDFENIISTYNLNLFFKELLFFVKDELVKNIGNEELVSRNIFILETLEESYLKAKNSFDAKTTFLVGIIKCVKDVNTSPLNSQIQPSPLTPLPKVEGDKKEKKEEKISVGNDYNRSEKINVKKEEEISSDDLFDIFGEEEQPSPLSPLPKVEGNSKKSPLLGGDLEGGYPPFDLEKFITQLKSLGSKGALTMSIRGSSLNFDGKSLIIYTKTKISLKQISTSDNIAIMTQALEKMGFSDINIEIK